MALAVRGVGGDDALAKARNVRVRVRTRRAGAEDQPPVLTDRILAFPGTLRVEQDWGSGRFAWLVTAKGGWCPAGEGPPVGDQVRRFMVREMYRQPVAILHAWRRGEAKVVGVEVNAELPAALFSEPK